MKDNQKIQPHVLQKYQIIKKLGSGAYGHVWKAKDKKNGATVALKKIFDAFQHSTDAQRTFRQISVLKQLNHDKIIRLSQVLAASNNQDIYLVFQFMESDLYHLIYQGKLQPVHIKYIMYQILLGLNYMHSSKLIHRDLKPSNILVNSDCSAKICDFGLVRYLGSQIANFNSLTQGVATRWYRAPQILLGSNSYDTKADMWSLGCILAQILLKNPLFPGTCTTNQLQRIIQLTGQPSSADIKSIQAELGQVMIAEVCNGKIKKKLDIFSKVQDKNAIDLVYKLLQFNPNKRLDAEKALKHQYFTQFFNTMDLNVKIQNIVLEIDQNIRLQTTEYLNVIKDKFILKPTKVRQNSENKDRKKVGESPKSFSDLKKSRVSNKADSSISKSRLKTQQILTQIQENNSRNIVNRETNLFKELCKEKDRQKSMNRNQNRGGSKQNLSGTQNSLKKYQNSQKQKPITSFQSFSAVTNNLKKYNQDKKFGSFSGLKKTGKINPK